MKNQKAKKAEKPKVLKTINQKTENPKVQEK
jgi:hypothetical protein